MHGEQSVLDRIQRRQLKWYDKLLRMNDSRWSKKITCGYRTMEEKRKTTTIMEEPSDFMRSRNRAEAITEDRCFWSLGMDSCRDNNNNNNNNNILTKDRFHCFLRILN